MANYLAFKKNLDFLLADRTFSNFSSIGRKGFSFPKMLMKFFKTLSNWEIDNTKNYLNSKCYKIITFDENDEIIPTQSSL